MCHRVQIYALAATPPNHFPRKNGISFLRLPCAHRAKPSCSPRTASLCPFTTHKTMPAPHLVHKPQAWFPYPTSVVSISHVCGFHIPRLWDIRPTTVVYELRCFSRILQSRKTHTKCKKIARLCARNRRNVVSSRRKTRSFGLRRLKPVKMNPQRRFGISPCCASLADGCRGHYTMNE